MATQVPTVTSIEIVPVQPDPADRKVLAFQRARTSRPLEDVAYIVKIFLADELPPTGAGFALYLGDTPVPRYSGFDGGIYFTVHDPQFLADHADQPIRFEHDSGQVVETDVRLPGLPTPEATRFGLIAAHMAAGVALPTKHEALIQAGSPAVQNGMTFNQSQENLLAKAAILAPFNALDSDSKGPTDRSEPAVPFQPPMKTVLFIDDEPNFAKYYVTALEDEDYKVIFCDTAVGGLAYIREHSGEIGLVVLDIMMPTPNDVAAIETNDGTHTGIWLLRQVQELIEEHTISVIFLSNYRGLTVQRFFADQVPLSPTLISVISKDAITPMMLPQIVSRLCHKWRQSAPKP